MKQFNVLDYNFNSRKAEHYDVLPYFRDCWFKAKSIYDKEERNKVQTKEDLKNWIKSKSQYRFWARCEYEFLMAPWPIGSKKTNDDLSKLLTSEFNIHDYSQSITFWNTVCQDFKKIDIHEQIMMNIDVITDILAVEFKLSE